jgi:hypothetical protein
MGDVVAELTQPFGVRTSLRPGAVLFWAVNNTLFGRSPVGHHSMAVLMHSLTGWLVYLVALRVTGRVPASVVAALLFVAAPAQAEAVIWLDAAATTVTSGLLSMLAAYLWVSRGAVFSLRRSLVVAVLYLLALLCREAVAPLPVLLPLLDWATGRIPPRDRTRYLLAFLPLAAALLAYLLIQWGAGALSASYSYGVRLDLGLAELAWIWDAYPRALFRPLSDLVDWLAGRPYWLWPGAFILLMLILRPARWAGVWVVLALVPASTTYAPRMVYLALAGFAMGLAILLTGAVESLSARLSGKAALLPWLALAAFVALILVADFRALRREESNWLEAGRLAWEIPRTIHALLPDPAEGTELYVLGLPDSVNGAISLRWGLRDELSYLYDASGPEVTYVTEGPIVSGRIPLGEIECESNGPRSFMRYDHNLDEVRFFSLAEFRPDCRDAGQE